MLILESICFILEELITGCDELLIGEGVLVMFCDEGFDFIFVLSCIEL